MILSLYMDLIRLWQKACDWLGGKYGVALSFVGMKARDFYLIINDLGYSPKIKEIIFKNETVNKKTFIVPILNSVIILYVLLFLVSLCLKGVSMALVIVLKLLTNFRNSLRMMNSNFLDRNFNWYLRMAKFRYVGSVEGFNFLLENN